MKSIRALVLLCLCAVSLAMVPTVADCEPVLWIVGGDALYTVNTATAAVTFQAFLTLPGDQLFVANGGLAYDPQTDRLYCVGHGLVDTGQSRLYRIDRLTGVATEIGLNGAISILNSGGLAFDVTSGTLFGTGEENDGSGFAGTYLYTLDTTTGAATIVGKTAEARGTWINGLGCDPVTGVLYGNGFRSFDGQSALFTLDKALGTATFVGQHGIALGRQMNYGGIAVHPVTHVLYGNGSVTASATGLYTVGDASGAATLVGSFAPNIGATDSGMAFIDDSTTGVPGAVGAGLRLRPNQPNPFNPRTTISFDLPNGGPVRLAVFDVAGRLVRTLVDGNAGAGHHAAVWDGRDAAGRAVGSGTYVARLESGGQVATQNMTLVR